MEVDLKGLEDRIARLIALSQHLREDNLRLRQELVAVRNENKQLVEKVVLTMHDPGVRNSTLLPLRELFAVTSYPATRAALVKKYGPAVEKLIKPELAMKMVQGQSWALVMYLHEGAGGKYRASFVKYVGSALAGDGSLAAFQKAFPGVDVGALEAEFYAWLFELYGTMFPGRKADPLALKRLGTPAGAKGEAAKPVDLAAALELDVPSAHAGLLFEIRSGRFETAIAELEKLRARPKVGAHAARLETEILRQRGLRSGEPHGEQHELCRLRSLGIRLLDGYDLTLVVLLPANLDGDDFFYTTVLITDEFLDRREIGPGVLAEFRRGFFLAVIHLVDTRPLGPRVVGGSLGRGLRHDFELRERTAALAHRRADAIGARVTATDDDDVETLGMNLRFRGTLSEHRLRRAREVVHREMDSAERASLDGQIARLRGARAEHDGIEIPKHHLGFVVVAHTGVADELDALLLEQFDATHHDRFFVELHVRDAVHE